MGISRVDAYADIDLVLLVRVESHFGGDFWRSGEVATTVSGKVGERGSFVSPIESL